MRTGNLVLAFVLELVMLASLAWGCLALPWDGTGPLFLAVAVPLVVMVVWGLFAAPKARFPLPVAGTVALKAVLLATGVLALAFVGQPVLAILDAVLIAANLALAVWWGQFARTTESLQKSLLSLVDDYARRFPGEGTVSRFREFAASGEPLQGRTNLRRHITGSAWVVNPGRTAVLLTHHAKLGIWVQLGGHVDEGEDWTAAALREAREESGLSDLRLVGSGLFDLDIHVIPARPDVPAHEHYDLRFLVEADDTLPLTVSEESHDVAWVPLVQLENFTTEESQLRMKQKTGEAKP